MKILLFLVVVFVLIWLLRGGASRGSRPDRPAAGGTPGSGPKAMPACAQCGLHLPADEALPGRGGVFCTEAHRQQYERSHAGRT